MAITVEFIGPPGQTLTLLVCAYGTYTAANGAGDAATETARACLYTATVAEALSGWHTAHIVSADGWELAIGDVYMVDGSTCRVRARPAEDPAAGEVLVGVGADSVTVTIAVGGVAVADADVWITSDAAGTSVVAGTLQTDSNGRITFMLDHGATYYLWMQKDGVNSIKGERFVAARD